MPGTKPYELTHGMYMYPIQSHRKRIVQHVYTPLDWWPAGLDMRIGVFIQQWMQMTSQETPYEMSQANLDWAEDAHQGGQEFG